MYIIGWGRFGPQLHTGVLLTQLKDPCTQIVYTYISLQVVSILVLWGKVYILFVYMDPLGYKGLEHRSPGLARVLLGKGHTKEDYLGLIILTPSTLIFSQPGLLLRVCLQPLHP